MEERDSEKSSRGAERKASMNHVCIAQTPAEAAAVVLVAEE